MITHAAPVETVIAVKTVYSAKSYAINGLDPGVCRIRQNQYEKSVLFLVIGANVFISCVFCALQFYRCNYYNDGAVTIIADVRLRLTTHKATSTGHRFAPDYDLLLLP